MLRPVLVLGRVRTPSCLWLCWPHPPGPLTPHDLPSASPTCFPACPLWCQAGTDAPPVLMPALAAHLPRAALPLPFPRRACESAAASLVRGGDRTLLRAGGEGGGRAAPRQPGGRAGAGRRQTRCAARLCWHPRFRLCVLCVSAFDARWPSPLCLKHTRSPDTSHTPPGSPVLRSTFDHPFSLKPLCWRRRRPQRRARRPAGARGQAQQAGARRLAAAPRRAAVAHAQHPVGLPCFASSLLAV
jgi:hypothetical protein